MTAPPTIVGASAGSGKTFRLTAEVTRAVRPGAERPVRLEGLMAVTYTRKAEAELASRIRRALVEHAAFDEAARLPVAYLGTVHAVCMRLLEELALDAGVSPFPEVMPDDQGRRMHEAIEESLPRALIEQLNEIARRLEVLYDTRTQRYDWIRRVFQIMELARGNRIAPGALPAMARQSVASLINHLAPEGDALAIEEAFTIELERAIDGLARSGEDKQNTREALAEAREIQGRRQRGDLRWSDWMKAAKLAPSVKCRAIVAPLAAAAAACHAHPALHDDLRAFTIGVFEAARLALAGYARWKAERRIVDYTDMIDRALTLVEDPEVANELAERLDLLVVDELQDTSPLQLALFTRLHRLAGRSLWVGDGKQCIFEYAGADPRLMDSLIEWVERQGAAAEWLDRNYRSRPELVHACSELFARAFAPLGVDEASVRVTAARPALAALSDTPPLAVWWLDGKSVDDDAEAIASAAHRLLATPSGTRVLDRVSGQVRPIEPRDLGILTSTNAEAKRIAAALGRRGVHATVPRDGLMATPEGVLVEAALSWVLDDGDLSARATLEALAGWNGGTPDEWLGAWLRGEGRAPPAWLAPLASLREQLDVLSPGEALDRALRLLDLATWCARWPEPRQRLGNLDALRALAARYEDRCTRLREPATLAGLVRYFAEARQPRMIGDEERATDDQFTGSGDGAVTVSTYHRAKGLEWPIVVLGSLDRPRRRDAFDPSPESQRQDFDPDDPLGGRWIRYWPWPFGKQQKVRLADDVAASAMGRAVADRERKERVRLLYVGFTRARDQLVLALRQARGAAKAAWLDELCDGDGAPLIELPVRADDGAVATARLAGCPLPCRVTYAADEEVGGARGEARRLARRGEGGRALRYRITPSAREAGADHASYRVDRVVSLGEPIRPRSRADWNVVGDAVHAFLAADVRDDGEARRRARATRILEQSALLGILDAADLLVASDRLRAFVDARWPGATWEREVPITALLDGADGRRRIEGVIDLLLTTADGVVVIDHKSYPAPTPTLLAERAVALAPQLATYAVALARCGRSVVGAHLHFPLAGAWVDLRPVRARC